MPEKYVDAERKLAEREFAFIAPKLELGDMTDALARVVNGEFVGHIYWSDYADEERKFGCGCFFGPIAMRHGYAPEFWESSFGGRVFVVFKVVSNFRNELLGDRLEEFLDSKTNRTALENEVFMIDLDDTPENSDAAAWLYNLIVGEIARRSQNS